ncbi:hypothetical protein M5D96_009967 [Drosophila gunungcola]|uniref:Uncharacterized protein n=1 Tax=Drosophila gunungcola TaxID=103775 RepID=A0A9P9YI46_9MUSC|nr:hypothetical protein M5D96_009967 [Drosophila gunungcola]
MPNIEYISSNHRVNIGRSFLGIIFLPKKKKKQKKKKEFYRSGYQVSI